MSSFSFKHNKKRNSALVYEFLIRRMSSQLIAKDQLGYRRTFGMVERYYGSGTPLGAERELFDVIRNTRGASRSIAERVLGEVKEHAVKIEGRLLETKKGDLIREINHSIGQGFFSQHRIPEYRLLASIQMVIDGSRLRLDRLTENVQRVRLEEALIEFMTTQEPIASQSDELNEDRVDGLVCSLAAQKFHEKYGDALIGPQKKLLDVYLRSIMTGKQERLDEHISAEVVRLDKALVSGRLLKEVREDKVMESKYSEAQAALKKISGPGDVAKKIEELMLYQKLVAELEGK